MNLTMEAGTRTISGQVRDSKTNAGLPASAGNDSPPKAGSSLSITPTPTGISAPRLRQTNGPWSHPAHAVSQIGYVAAVGAVAVDTSTGNANNVTLSAAKATTLLYGTVTDNSNAPLAGLDLVAIDEKYLFQASAVTDSSGNYVIAISGGSGQWTPQEATSKCDRTSPLYRRSFIRQKDRPTNVNFSASKASAQLSGGPKDNNGAGISDINYKAIKATPVPTRAK